MNSPETDNPGATSSPAAESPKWLIPSLLLASVVACFAAGFIVGGVQRLVYPPDHNQLGDPPWYLEAVLKSMMINDAVGYGALGAVLFGVLGVLLGLCKSPGKAAIALVIGAIFGLVAGAASGPIGYYIESTSKIQTQIDGSIKVFMIWGPMYACFGLVGGLLAIWLGPASGMSRAITSGLAAAIVTLTGYMFAATAIFPVGYPNSMFPESVGIRHMAMISLGLCGSLAMVLAILQSKGKKSASGNVSAAANA